MLYMLADLCRLHSNRVRRFPRDTQQAVGLQAGTDVVEHDTSECLGLTVYSGVCILKDTCNKIIPNQMTDKRL